MIRQLAPGMVQQVQSVCSDCNGEGTCRGAGGAEIGEARRLCITLLGKSHRVLQGKRKAVVLSCVGPVNTGKRLICPVFGDMFL